MAIRRLRFRTGGLSILGQVINVPVDVNNMVTTLPRNLDDDYAINISIKRNLIHKSSYLSGVVKKRVVKEWLKYLIDQPLYRQYSIKVDYEMMDRELQNHETRAASFSLIDELESDAPGHEVLASNQHSLLWNEDSVLVIAPGQNVRPIQLASDTHAEELSFPAIYYGHPRVYPPTLRVTPYVVANSEVRRKDRRGATPEHILYVMMKILRYRVVDGIRNYFHCAEETENITKRMIGEENFLENCLEKNFSFLKSIPNSAQYWVSRRKDLFAMIRQLGKPTCFLTLSANETEWPHLITTLFKLAHPTAIDQLNNPLADLRKEERSELVNKDPVTCCIYFQRKLEVLLSIITSKRSYNPFGRYWVKNYFLRIEFQHRGSPHAHILLWMNDDPAEPVSEDMPRSIELVDHLCSVSSRSLPDHSYHNQIHRHTFTCTKRGESSCRFGIPFWPTNKTRVLLPLSKSDGRKRALQCKAISLRGALENKHYEDIESFLLDNNLSDNLYLDVVRSTLIRPQLLYRRSMSEILVNTFNPWIATTLNSNMDLQYIIDEYSCASYVVDYVNKSNRGMSNLHRELLKLGDEYPNLTYEHLLKRLGSKILNSVEISAQEAAWFLLGQSMSRCSKKVIYIPTCWPSERYKSFKTRKSLKELDADSTDIWSKSIIEKYEERIGALDAVCLADFVAWYNPTRSESCDLNIMEDTDGDDLPTESDSIESGRRRHPRIIRYRNYDQSDTENFQREMVTLFVPFRNEHSDLLDRNSFKAIYSDNIGIIAKKRAEYERTDLAEILRQCEEIARESKAPTSDDPSRVRNFLLRDVASNEESEDLDPMNHVNTAILSTMCRKEGIMTKEEFCNLMSQTNRLQRELLVEIIHRVHLEVRKPLQIFFTGPAGTGKTFVLKLIMEIYNRYCPDKNDLNNSYVACATTGKAAVQLGGTTVHSAYHLNPMQKDSSISPERLHGYRQLFRNIRCVIIDEVSMLSSIMLHRINHRLQQITGNWHEFFGGMDMILCGDLRQLPPVSSAPVYSGSSYHVERFTVWHSLDYLALEEVVRQNDATFSAILTKIGDGLPLDSTESSLIESRFRTCRWVEEHLEGVVRLFHQNSHVDGFNIRTMKNGLTSVATDRIIGYSNVDECTSAQLRLNRMSTIDAQGLPNYINLVIDQRYMLTSNVDVNDGLVNGAIGVLRHIEFISDQQQSERVDPMSLRLWIEFSDQSTGSLMRQQQRKVISRMRRVVHRSWTPIISKSANISLTKKIKSKRQQFPLTPASAITIHKSQGGTFDKIVYQYAKNQPNQLVYVALSRVKSIEGLHIINDADDHTFYHKFGSNSPSIKRVRDELSRLSKHRLSTLTSEVRSFIGSHDNNHLVVCTINVQSLPSHSKDLSSDQLIMRSNILVLTETWMADLSSDIEIEGFHLIMARHSSRRASAQLRRSAGGVAIYVSSKLRANCVALPHDRYGQTGDFVKLRIETQSSGSLYLAGVYIHPGSSVQQIKAFLGNSMSEWRRNSHEGKGSVVVTGDFNVDVRKHSWILEYMRDEFGLVYVGNEQPTTLSSSIIDLTFMRDVDVKCMPYVGYFSYHRPLFNLISPAK